MILNSFDEIFLNLDLFLSKFYVPYTFGQLWHQLGLAHTRALSWHEVVVQEGPQPQEAFASDEDSFEVACLEGLRQVVQQ